MLTHPTLDQLKALRLEGMITALEDQRRDPHMAELEFEERLAMLVERQWLWKSNRALAARLHRVGQPVGPRGNEHERRRRRVGGLRRLVGRSRVGLVRVHGR